jgi:hypothetical protein
MATARTSRHPFSGKCEGTYPQPFVIAKRVSNEAIQPFSARNWIASLRSQ